MREEAPAPSGKKSGITGPSQLVFNGDFSFGDFPDEIPGWERHGRDGNADLTDDGELHFGAGPNTYQIHNPLYIPLSAQFLKFDYRITNNSNDDELQVAVGHTTRGGGFAGSSIGTLPLTTEKSDTARFDITDFAGDTRAIRFLLNYNVAIESDVYIDNVRLELSPSIRHDKYDGLDFDYTATSESFEVWNDGGETLNYSASISAGGSYFSIDPPSGTSSGWSDRVIHTVTVDRNSIPPGQTVTGRIRIDSADASDNPQYIELTASAGSLIVSTLVDEDDGDHSAGDLSLREALGLAGNTPDTDVIAFDNALNGGTITLDPSSQTLFVDSDVEIHGPGADRLTIRNGAAPALSVFLVKNGVTAAISGLTIIGNNTGNSGLKNDGTLTVADCTFTGGSGGAAGGISNLGTLQLVDSNISSNSGFVGGLFNAGEATITNSTIANNRGEAKGGIHNIGELAVNNSIVTGNSALSGGGISNSNEGSRLTLNNTKISSNTATGFGGGIHNSGTWVTINRSEISGNSAVDGAGIYDTTGTLEIRRSSIARNTATGVGGGIAGFATISVDNCSIVDNSANDHGGGVSAVGNMTLTSSTISNNTVAEGRGGGIAGFGQCVLITCEVSDNSAHEGGGGVYNQGDMSLTSSTVSNNTVNDGIGGGGVYNLGEMSMTSSTISNNAVIEGSGGGIRSDGKLVLDACDVRDNLVTHSTHGGGGGGIGSGADLTVTNSTVSGNSARFGGGILETSNGATFLLANSTISDNTARDSTGGGVYIVFDVDALFTNCTITGNKSGWGTGGIDMRLWDTLTLNNSLVAGNAPWDVQGTFSPSSSHNLIGVINGSSNLDADPNTLFGTMGSPLDPVLGPLDDNGGPTSTHILLAGSPAIDAGSNPQAVDAEGNPLTADQRGNPRISGARVDVGAYEYQWPVYWDQAGPGNWDEIDGDTGYSRWVDAEGNPLTTCPQESTNAVVRTDTVTVGADCSVRNFTVESGAILVRAGKTLTVEDDVELAGGADYVCEVDGTANGLIAAAGNVTLGGTLNIRPAGVGNVNPSDPSNNVGDHTYTLLDTGPDGSVLGKFATEPPLDDPATLNLREDQLGLGVFNLEKLTYVGRSDPDNLMEPATGVTAKLFIATGGDGNGDGKVDVVDITNLVANFGLPDRQWTDNDTAGGTTGRGDGRVDVTDITDLVANFGISAASTPDPGPAAAGTATAEEDSSPAAFTADALFTSLAWIEQFEQSDPQSRPSQKGSPAAEAVDVLLASYRP